MKRSIKFILLFIVCAIGFLSAPFFMPYTRVRVFYEPSTYAIQQVIVPDHNTDLYFHKPTKGIQSIDIARAEYWSRTMDQGKGMILPNIVALSQLVQQKIEHKQ